MKRVGLLLGMTLGLIAATALGEEKPCNGPYKGKKVPQAELDTRILPRHEQWVRAAEMSRRASVDPRRANLCGAVLQNARLNRAILEEADLEDALLSDADLRGANLTFANLNGAQLYRANLSGAELNQTKFNKASLLGANLAGVNLSGAKLYRANLSLANLSGAKIPSADLRQASLNRANLMGASLGDSDLSDAILNDANVNGARLGGARLTDAKLVGANVSNATLTNGNLRGADLRNANLSGADLRGADFSGADFRYANLDGADLSGANLKDVIFEPRAGSLPPFSHFVHAESLAALRYDISPHSLVELRNKFKEAGFREQEREVTYALERGRTEHTSWMERGFRIGFFEWTVGYGLYPGRPLWILLGGIVVFAFVYLAPLSSRSRMAGNITRVWPAGRIVVDENVPGLARDARAERLQALGVAAIGHALYFSTLSAFNLGWRDLNVGNWISRIQPQEYSLSAVGWVRVVSGVQSLLSVYLVALWALTYFGRPFE